MPSAQLSQALIFPGYSFNDQAAGVAVTGLIVKEIALVANSALNSGTMTNKTDANTGVVTLQAGHTIVTSGALVDCYWVDGTPKRRYGLTATKSTNDVTLEGGAGDDLPANATAVVVCAQTTVEVNFDGDNALFIAIMYRNGSDTGALGSIDLQDSGNASIEQVGLIHETANGGIQKTRNVWNISGGDTNVFAGNRITQAFASHDSTSAGTAYILVGQ
jgi:hypothetical protein